MIYKKSLVVLLGAISYQIVAVIGGSPDIIGGGDPVTVTICSDYMWETDCPGPTPGCQENTYNKWGTDVECGYGNGLLNAVLAEDPTGHCNRYFDDSGNRCDHAFNVRNNVTGCLETPCLPF